MFIPKCDASCFHKVAAEAIPQGVAWKFGPMLRHLRETEALIGKYDKMLARYADAHFGEEVGLLQTIPGVGMLTACAFTLRKPYLKMTYVSQCSLQHYFQ